MHDYTTFNLCALMKVLSIAGILSSTSKKTIRGITRWKISLLTNEYAGAFTNKEGVPLQT
ncbi:MAG: hypothetical protein ABFD49_01140 [Armatimonadota bacterium]|nr:hypothetical protein [bacterium]